MEATAWTAVWTARGDIVSTVSSVRHAAHRPVAEHTRTEVLGLLLVSGAIAFMLAAGLTTGIPFSDASFLIPAALMPAAGAGLAWRFGSAGRLSGLLLGILGAGMTFWLVFGLFVPASFIEFTTGTAYVLGVALMIGGTVAAARHRHDLREEATPTERRIDHVVLGIVGAAFLLSIVLWMFGRQTVDATATAGLPEVTASNFAFEDLTATSVDGRVELVVRNSDAFHHEFTIDALDVHLLELPGSAADGAFDAPPGTYTFYCNPHTPQGGEGPDDMAATLTVR